MKWPILFLLLFSYSLRAQTISTFAGSGIGMGGFSGDGGPATAAHIGNAGGGNFDRFGNYYFAIRGGNRVRKVQPSGIITTVAGNGSGGFFGDGGQATNATIDNPIDVAVDTFGNVYIADSYNNRVRKIDISTGNISTVAGNGTSGFFGDGGPATSASLSLPQFICFDKFNNMFVSDFGNQRIRKISPTGYISTYAGNGAFGYSSDGGLADTTRLHNPFGIATDTSGNLYIADKDNYRIRKVNAISGIITTFAGNGIGVYNGEGITALAAGINPRAIKLDVAGNLYFVDFGNQRMRKVNAAGIVTTMAGTGVAGFSGDGGAATIAKLYNPEGIALDACNNIYIADVANQRIRKVTNPSTFTPPTIFIYSGPSDTICSGTLTTFHVSVTGITGVPSCQWYVNGLPVGSGGTTYTYAPSNGDSIRCRLTLATVCFGTVYVNSNSIHMVVNPLTTPSISITTTPGDTVCAGSSILFTGSPAGGGGVPTYRWYVNSVLMGATSSVYSYAPTAGDSVYCILTTSALCPTSATAHSNTIHPVVNPSGCPTISIAVSPGDSVCLGTMDIFTSSIAFGGSSPSYNWYLNGSSTGVTSTTYAMVPSSGDSVYCILTSNATCATSLTARSNTKHLVVETFVVPSISLTGLPGAALGATVTVNAIVAGAGSSYLIHWMNHGIEFTTTIVPTVTYVKGVGIDTITASIVSTDSVGCYDSTVSSGHYVEALTTGIFMVGAGMEASLFPSPMVDHLQIESAKGIRQVTITDLLGQVVFDRAFMNERININTSEVLPGVYLVRVFFDDGAFGHYRVVKK